MDINLDNIMELLKQSQLNDTINQDIDNTIPIDENIEIEKYTIDDDIDINDYIPVDKDDNLVEFDILNVFTCYYKQLYNSKQESHMLDGIDPNKRDSTNRCIEVFYEEMHKLQMSTDPNKDVLYEPDDEDIDYDHSKEIYILYLEDEPKYATKYMLPLLRYTSELDWLNSDWSIVKIK